MLDNFKDGKSEKFKIGDVVRIKKEVTIEQNSNLDYLKGQRLIIHNYTYPEDFDFIIFCIVLGSGEPDLYPIPEWQLELIQ